MINPYNVNSANTTPHASPTNNRLPRNDLSSAQSKKMLATHLPSELNKKELTFLKNYSKKVTASISLKIKELLTADKLTKKSLEEVQKLRLQLNQFQGLQKRSIVVLPNQERED